MRAKSSHQRLGFTLIELLVAVALTIVIMGIIGWAMGKSIDAFRNLNGIANLQSKLVAAQIVMQRDLSAEHFGGNFQTSLSGPYVADQRLDQFGWMPPEQGYFEIRQGSEGALEGFDADGLWSTQAVDHSLRFTARLSGRREEDWFYAYPDNPSPPGPALPANWGDVNFNRTPGIATRWAEIAYFLYPNGKNANGTTLYALYREQKAVQGLATTPAVNPVSSDLSRMGVIGNGYNSTTTVTSPGLRGIQYPLAPSPAPKFGDDILVTDVISFEIKVLWSTGPASVGLIAPRQGAGTYYGVGRPFNVDWPFDTLQNIAGWGMRFDTMSQSTAPVGTNWDDPASFLAPNNNLPRYRVRVQALQIRIRVWDFNTQQTRQMCFVQDI